jgi:putative hydrolase of the HAD superfamily
MDTRNLSIDAVLFDYGMVLSGPPDPVAWESLRRVSGFDEAKLQLAYWAHRLDYDRGTMTAGQYWQAVAKTGGLAGDAPFSELQMDALIDADTALWTQLNEPMVAWAARLQSAGIRTGILSNIGDAMMHGILAKFTWLEGFDHHTWSHQLKLAKPELAIYRHATEGLGVEPAKILFIDDREENIAGALRAGMQAIQYSGHEAFVRELHDRGWGALWLA